MRRRWKALVAVGAVALVAGLILLLSPHDDGLDWIRSYGVQERSGPDLVWFINGQPIKDSRVEFNFKSEPSKLLSKLKSLSPDEYLYEDQDLGAMLFGSLSDGTSFTWVREDRCLILAKKTQPNPIELAFAKLRRFFP